MSAVLLGQHKPGSEAWHELRTRGLGGSEIAAVVGLSPFESAFGLWHRKKGTLGPQSVGEHVEWGNRLEAIVADHFAERHPEFVTVATGTHHHSERTWQLANPDRLLFDENVAGYPRTIPDALLEVKTSRYGDGFGRSGSDAIPLHYRCQVMHYMDVLGLDVAHIAVLIGGNDYREYVIGYDAADARALRDAGEAFWASLQTDDEPPIDASFDTYEAVRELHPDIDGTDVEIDPTLYMQYAATKDRADDATAQARQAKAELLNTLGTARRALVNGTPVLRRQPGRGGSVSLYPVKEAS